MPESSEIPTEPDILPLGSSSDTFVPKEALNPSYAPCLAFITVKTDTDDYLVLINENNVLRLPGGKPKPKENPHTTITREIQEETGLDIPIEEIEQLGYLQKPDNPQAVIALFQSPQTRDQIPDQEDIELIPVSTFLNQLGQTNLPLARTLNQELINHL